MFKILIVDDEPIVRIAFQTMLNWNELGFEVSGEAANGAEALEFLESHACDVLITDIKMPHMDGLTLIEHVTKRYPHIKNIVLSAYDEFALAQKAIRLGASDYMVKTEMTEQSLRKLFEKMLKEIEQSDKQEKMQTVLSANRMLQAEAVYKHLISKKEPVPLTGELELYKKSALIVAVFGIDEYSEVQKRFADDIVHAFADTFSVIMRDTLFRDYEGDVFRNSVDEYVAVMYADKPDQLQEAFGLFAKAQKAIKQMMDISVTCGISEPSIGISQIRKLYKQAQTAFSYRFSEGAGTVISYSEISGFSKQAVEFDARSAKLSEYLKNPSSDHLEGLLDFLLFKGESIHHDDFITVRETFERYHAMIRQHHYTMDSQSQAQDMEFPRYAQTMSELAPYLLAALNSLGDKDDVSGDNRLLKQAKTYIKANYTQSLTLTEVASVLAISEGYLSRLFVSKGGTTFTRYINNVRIKKAKEYLLNSNLKVYEIAEKVGFANTEYFSRTFKEIVGKSPKDFVK